MQRARVHQLVLIGSLTVFSWLVMMLLHEAGHVVGAGLTGGTVQRVVWHPLVFSRTDVAPNPAPITVVWLGPVIGAAALLPVVITGWATRWRRTYLAEWVAGFCLIANGLYIGVGVVDPVGDARVMLRLGTPGWVMASFGIVTCSLGFYLWHRASRRLGFDQDRTPVNPRDALAGLIAAVALVLVGVLLGDAG